MKPIDQTQLVASHGKGNCMQAAVASLFNLELEDVPAFRDAGDVWEINDALEDFFLKRGYELLRIDRSLSLDHAFYLACGDTDRGTYHMVVYQAGKLAHDPHPSKTGLTNVDRVYLPIPLDPARSLETGGFVMEWLDEAILEAKDALKKAEFDKHILWQAGYLKGLKAAQLILRKELKNKSLKTREVGE